MAEITLEEQLLDQYLFVSRCWNDHKQSVSNKMTNEKAIRLLQDTISRSSNWRLKRRANDLLGDIICLQEEPSYLKGLTS